MSALVRQHYPVSRLPVDLQEGLDTRGRVTIEITPEPPSASGKALVDFLEAGENVHGEEAAVLDWVRALREDR